MKRTLLALCTLLVFVSMSFAAAKSSFGTSLMLRGTYAVQAHNTHLVNGFLVSENDFGTLVFNGLGTITGGTGTGGGSYWISPDGSGTLTFTVPVGTAHYDIQVGGPPSAATGPWTTFIGHETGCNECSTITGILQ